MTTTARTGNLLDTNWGGTTITIRETYRIAVDVAQAEIEGDFTDDATQADLALARQALTLPAHVELTEDQFQALHRVVNVGVEYMVANRYDEDESFPEEAFACAILSRGSGGNVKDTVNWSMWGL